MIGVTLKCFILHRNINIKKITHRIYQNADPVFLSLLLMVGTPCYQETPDCTKIGCTATWERRGNI